MTDAEILDAIKIRLAIDGNFHDALLLAYAYDVIEYLVGAGVSQEYARNPKAKGIIARGVADLWNFGAGDGKFSEIFVKVATQFTLGGEAE